MSDASQPPVATGTLAQTPFTHVILYVYRRQLSGTLIVRGAQEYRVLFQRGRALAARVPQPMAALDEALMPLTAEEAGQFEFYETDLVGSGPGVATGIFDPFVFVVEAVRKHTHAHIVADLLAKHANTPMVRDVALDLRRLPLTPEELRVIAPVQRGPLTPSELLRDPSLPREAAERVLYTLIIVRALVPARGGSQPMAAAPGTRPPDELAHSLQPGATSLRPSDTRTSLQAPAGSDAPSRRSSGDKWRAIATRASEIFRARTSSGVSQAPEPDARRPTYSSQRTLAVPSTQPGPRSLSRPSMPVTQTRSTSGDRLPSMNPGQRSPSMTSLPAQSPEGRTLSPGPFRTTTAPKRASTSSMPPRVSTRPSLADVESLDPDGKVRRVELLCQRAEYDEALVIARGLLETDRKNARYLGLLSHVLFGRATDTHVSKEIVEVVNQALRIDPDQIHALYTKARCYKRLGKEREALHYFRRTVAVDPTHLDAAREARLLVSRLSDKRKR